MKWDITLSIAAFLAVLIAVRGETWNTKNNILFRRITQSGWAAIVIGAVVLTVSIFKSANDSREKADLERRVADKIEAVGESVDKQFAKNEAEADKHSRAAANQVLSELAPQMTFYKVMLANQKLPTSEPLIFTVQQFADLLEKKLQRYGSQLSADSVRAGEAALGRQKELYLLLTFPSTVKSTGDAIRSKMTECLSAGKAFGDILLMQLGYPEGMDHTLIIAQP